jgi:hypothetical protein
MSNEPKRDWLERLMALLPASLRPSDDDERFLAACRRAYENEWAANSLARLIVASDSPSITNKPLLVIRQLERLGQRPERSTLPELVHEHCSHGCMLGWIDREDVDCTTPCPIHRPVQTEALRQRIAVSSARNAQNEPVPDDATRAQYVTGIRASLRERVTADE